MTSTCCFDAARTMIVTLAFLLTGIATTYRFEDAIAQNVSIIATRNNRVRYDTVLFADGVTCNVPTKAEFEFNTATDATAAWQAREPPFSMPRGYHLIRIEGDHCITLTTDATIQSLLFYMLIMAGLVIDPVCWVFIKRHCCRSTPRPAAVEPTSVNPTVPPLSLYAATMLAETAWARDDICPVTQEKLKAATSVLAPPCGHIVSGAGRPPNNMCPICRAPTHYTEVLAKVPVLVEP